MKKYELKDGGIIAVTSANDFVTKLRESSKFDSKCTNEQYMFRFAERYKIQTGEDIKTDNPEVFLSELARTGFIK